MKVLSLKNIAVTVWSIFITVAAPLILNAQQGQTGPSGPPANSNPGTLNINLFNPIKVGSIEEFLVTILNIIIVIATPIIVIFIIYSGFKYVMARGNASEIEEATKSLTYAIIGGVLIIGAVAISTIIGNLVGAFSS
jgi:hypothetical protein